jgi:hypothetical protein
MDALTGQLSAFITWIQEPAPWVYAISLIFAGYEYYMNGERGGQIAKKTVIGSTIMLIVIKAAYVLATSLAGKVNF